MLVLYANIPKYVFKGMKLRNKSIMRIVVIMICVLTVTKQNKQCSKETRQQEFFKMKDCHRSTLLPVVFWGHAHNVKDCAAYARQKNGLAFNFSPLDVRKYNRGITPTCQVLGCPETARSSTLVEDVGFDYYSVYGNWTMTENTTCIKSIGLFILLTQKQNYIQSISSCQKLGGDIADVSSDTRTKHLSNIINTLESWYKVAYVGLDDLYQEGCFMTSSDVVLRCLSFRSWAPGHPISDTDEYNCVVLDDNQLWRVVDCRRKLPVLCELFPQKPQKQNFDLCNKFTDNIKKRKCMTKLEKTNDLIKNLTRLEQCAIWNAEDNHE